jgi:hypothetical protein
MVKMNILAFLTTVLSVSDTMEFVRRPALKARTPQAQVEVSHRFSSPNDLATLAAPLLLSSTIAAPSGYFLGTATSALLDPRVEAEVLTDFAHIGLDLSSYLGPATPALRLGIVIGRLCAIASDYIPDQQMNPEEIIFQGTMLCLASAAFLRSFLPILLGATAKTTFRDRQAQRMLHGVGITWTQYKAMVAVALDWVQVDPYEYVEDDENCMYWLYDGYVHLQTGKNIQTITAGSGYNSLLGDFASLLHKNEKNSDKQNPLIKAGGSGATLLRIDTQRLNMLMDHDPSLAESIRTLLVKGMSEKLSAFVEA